MSVAHFVSYGVGHSFTIWIFLGSSFDAIFAHNVTQILHFWEIEMALV